MKIERAIKNLKSARHDAGMIPTDEYTATIDLAIEALRRVKDSRREDPLYPETPLPGETEEG